jgi:glutathione S-transferase
MPNYTALVTVLAVTVYFSTAILVSRARKTFGVSLPAIGGHADFERVYRTQMNTLESMPVFLPMLWLTALYVGDVYAASVGLTWVVGRIFYIWGYTISVEKRGPGFLIQAIAQIVLLVSALIGIVLRLTHGA